MLFPVAIERGDETHAYSVTVPDLPGCFSAGDTWDEALSGAREAIAGHLEVMAEHGEEVPRAGVIEDWIEAKEFAGWVWSLVEVDVTPYLGRSHKINVTLPDILLRRIDDTVSRNPAYKTRSGFLAEAALHELSRG